MNINPPPDQVSESARYLRACQDPFWQQVFAVELDYLRQHLRPGDKILSVGCGPAFIEAGLAEYGFAVTGLDVSREAIASAPDTLRTVVAPAEKMPFADAAFDVVLFIVSLQFVDNYRQALTEAARVLIVDGRIIAMLLNTGSAFYKTKSIQPDSYVGKLKHHNMGALQSAVAENFVTDGEYFLGIADGRILDSNDPDVAALYVVRGQKKEKTNKAKSY